jgi:outer membrane protein TolC
MIRVRTLTALAVLLTSVTTFAQRAPLFPGDRYLRGLATDERPGPTIALTLLEAVRRGLGQNLGVLLEEQDLKAAEGRRWTQLSGLLPDVRAVVRESQQKINLAAFGFTGFSGLPTIIGPFTVFDARVAVSQPLLDVGAIYAAHEGAANVKVARHDYQDARNLVVLVVSNLYLQAVAGESRVEAAQAELSAAEVLYGLAVDQKSAGLVAGIDVLRADLERKSASQRRIVAENDVARAKLQLARAIGLPLGQEFTLTDRMPYAPVPTVDADALIEQALSRREDVLSAQARVDAAQAALQSARGDRLPSLHAEADYGAIGTTVASAAATYGVSANVHVPLFDRGRTKARVIENAAELKQRESELADLRSGVTYDVQLALRDLSAAAEQVSVAQSAMSLAAQTLTQAQDRFRAGVASNIEVVQAQQAEVAARESHIASLYTHNLAKVALARAIGLGEQDFTSFLGGQSGWLQKP